MNKKKKNAPMSGYSKGRLPHAADRKRPRVDRHSDRTTPIAKFLWTPPLMGWCYKLELVPTEDGALLYELSDEQEGWYIRYTIQKDDRNAEWGSRRMMTLEVGPAVIAPWQLATVSFERVVRVGESIESCAANITETFESKRKFINSMFA